VRAGPGFHFRLGDAVGVPAGAGGRVVLVLEGLGGAVFRVTGPDDGADRGGAVVVRRCVGVGDGDGRVGGVVTVAGWDVAGGDGPTAGGT
jgi:hypothetical protein